jgi:fatty acid desaturase
MLASAVADPSSLQRDLDDLRARTLAQLGPEDEQHIKNVRGVANTLQIVGRTLIHFSLEPFSFGVGAVSLGLYKILENMEIGHNVSHGQYDFLNDPSLDSKTYEWDIVGTSKTWKRAHNVTHHVYTNVLGKDDDFGYLFFRLSEQVPWKPHHLVQPFATLGVGLFFDHMVSYYHARPSEYLTAERGTPARRAQRKEMARDWLAIAKKTARHYGKEFVFFPLLAGPFAPKVALGNLLAEAVRNLWSYAVIHCGHLTPQTSVFDEGALAHETRAEYYARQILGSANIEAGPLLAILTGHLSHQIEHHLFPDIPGWRYREMAPEVRRIAEKHGLPYHTGTLLEQYGSVVKAMFEYALPNLRGHAAVKSRERATARPPAGSDRKPARVHLRDAAVRALGTRAERRAGA